MYNTGEAVSSNQITTWLKTYASSTNPIRTKVSKLYDIVLFIDLESFIKNDDYRNYDDGTKYLYKKYSTNKYLFMLNTLFKMDISELSGVVFPKKISSNWTSGQIRSAISYYMKDELIGPYIEYGVAPKDFVKYRVIKNDDGSIYIDRYVNTADENYSRNNISYMILYRNAEVHNYLIYGIDLEDNLSNLINNG